MEPFLVTDDLHGNRFACAVIPAVKNLPKGALPKCANNLVAVCKMIIHDDLIITSLIVVAVVVGRVVGGCHLLLALGTNAINRGIVEDLLALVLGQVLRLTAFQDC